MRSLGTCWVCIAIIDFCIASTAGRCSAWMTPFSGCTLARMRSIAFCFSASGAGRLAGAAAFWAWAAPATDSAAATARCRQVRRGAVMVGSEGTSERLRDLQAEIAQHERAGHVEPRVRVVDHVEEI